MLQKKSEGMAGQRLPAVLASRQRNRLISGSERICWPLFHGGWFHCMSLFWSHVEPTYRRFNLDHVLFLEASKPTAFAQRNEDMTCSYRVFLPKLILATFFPTTLQPPRDFEEYFRLVILATKHASFLWRIQAFGFRDILFSRSESCWLLRHWQYGWHCLFSLLARASLHASRLCLS